MVCTIGKCVAVFTIPLFEQGQRFIRWPTFSGRLYTTTAGLRSECNAEQCGVHPDHSVSLVWTATASYSDAYFILYRISFHGIASIITEICIVNASVDVLPLRLRNVMKYSHI